jgi:hypothetical protein
MRIVSHMPVRSEALCLQWWGRLSAKTKMLWAVLVIGISVDSKQLRTPSKVQRVLIQDTFQHHDKPFNTECHHGTHWARHKNETKPPDVRV